MKTSLSLAPYKLVSAFADSKLRNDHGYTMVKHTMAKQSGGGRA